MNTYTRQELMRMPLKLLRHLDIKDKEQEVIVQEVLNKRFQEGALPNDIFRGDVPDIRNKEDEIKWQKIIDAREAKVRAPVTVALADTETPPETPASEDVPPSETPVVSRTEAEVQAEVEALESKKAELEKTNLVCQVCGRQFKAQKGLGKHKLTHQ